jgi:hypothetical protein
MLEDVTDVSYTVGRTSTRSASELRMVDSVC